MEKFLSIAVTSEGNQLISANNVILVDAASATSTTTVITYAGGKAVTLTHAAQAAFDVRNAIQDAIVAALSTPWQSVAYTVTVPKAVSGIAVA